MLCRLVCSLAARRCVPAATAAAAAAAAGRRSMSDRVGRGDDELDWDTLTDEQRRLLTPDDVDALQDTDLCVQPAEPPSLQWIRDTDNDIERQLARLQQQRERANPEKFGLTREQVDADAAEAHDQISFYADPPALEKLPDDEYYALMKPYVDALPPLLGGRRPPIPSRDFDDSDGWSSPDLDMAFWGDRTEERVDDVKGVDEAALSRLDRADDELEGLCQALLSVDRRVKVTKSGRVMSLSVLTAVGNRNGVCGFGIGRGADVTSATNKSYRNAAKNLLFVPRVHEETLLHDVEGKAGATKVLIHAVGSGRGLRCSKLIRVLMELFGIRDATAKVIGSSNAYNVVRAVFAGLAHMQDHGVVRAVRRLPRAKLLPPYTVRLPDGFDAMRTPSTVKRIIAELNIE